MLIEYLFKGLHEIDRFWKVSTRWLKLQFLGSSKTKIYYGKSFLFDANRSVLTSWVIIVVTNNDEYLLNNFLKISFRHFFR